MPLLLSGQRFRTDLESFGCLAILTPLEGGAETRLLRRLRASGYQTQITSARGLGDPVVFLTQLHGIRPPHLGHQNVGRNGALGEVQQVIPQLNLFLNEKDPIILWLIEGQVLSQSELATAMPNSGGAYVYIERALGPLFGTISGIGLWLSLLLKSAFA